MSSMADHVIHELAWQYGEMNDGAISEEDFVMIAGELLAPWIEHMFLNEDDPREDR